MTELQVEEEVMRVIAGAITLSGLVLTYLAILCLGTAYYTIKGEEEV